MSLPFFKLTLNARAGEKFNVRSSPDLLDWSTVEGTVTVPSGPAWQTFEWTAPNLLTGKPRRFYRLQWR